jgi:hypothetical protein
MPLNFIACDREQAFLLPPSLLEWAPEDHLVWTILGAVEQLDLSAIYRVYRPDGHGRPAYEPGMMVALLLYAHAKGRGIPTTSISNAIVGLLHQYTGRGPTRARTTIGTDIIV